MKLHEMFMAMMATAPAKTTVTKFNSVLVRIPHLTHVHAQGVYRVNWRELERNKYAPWGRGSASRLPS